MKTWLSVFTCLAIAAALSGCLASATPPNRMTPPSSSSARWVMRSPARTCDRWQLRSAADPNSRNARLVGASGDASADVWSVGAYQSSSSFRTLAERWNGTTWSLVQTPNVGSGDNELAAVTALSSDDAWAVGTTSRTSTSQNRTLIEQWNGDKWNVIKSPSPGQLSSLGDVKAVSANDIWAVGAYFNLAGNQQSLVEHWNGKTWRTVSSPSPGGYYNSLSKLAILSSKNIWAVGSSSSGETSQTLVERWDGRIWSIVPSLNAPGALYSNLGAIAAVNANDIWAVGSSESYGNYETKTLIEHWSNSSWQIVPSPNMGTHSSILVDVAALSPKDVWSVGWYIDTSNFLPKTLIEHWNGKAWHIARSPNPGAVQDQLYGVALVGNTLWSVGDQAGSSENEPLIARLTPCH